MDSFIKLCSNEHTLADDIHVYIERFKPNQSVIFDAIIAVAEIWNKFYEHTPLYLSYDKIDHPANLLQVLIKYHKANKIVISHYSIISTIAFKLMMFTVFNKDLADDTKYQMFDKIYDLIGENSNTDELVQFSIDRKLKQCFIHLLNKPLSEDSVSNEIFRSWNIRYY